MTAYRLTLVVPARIKALENEIKQAKANLQLAEEAAGENAREQEDAVRELRDQEQITLKAEVNLRTVVLALAVHHKSIVESRREWYARTKMLRQSDATIDRIRETATQALQGAASRLDGLTATVTTLRAEQLAAIGEHGRLLKINERLGSELGEARTELSDRTTALEQTLQDLSSAEASIEALKSELSEARLQVEQITTSTSERIAGLESELDTVHAHKASLESEIADLLAKLLIAEKVSDELQESQSVQDSTIAMELQAAQARIKELDSELETLLESLAALEGERDDLARASDDKQSLVDKHLATIDQTQSMVARLEMTLREKEDTISALTSELAESRGSMAELESTLQQKGDALRDLHQEAMSTGQARIAALESELTDKAAEVEASQLQVERFSEEAAIQKAKVDELNNANEARVNDAQMLHDFSQLESSLRSEITMVQSQLQDTQNRLSEIQARLHASETIAKESQDTLASLQVENEEMKSRLGQATENASSAPATESELLLERITGEYEGHVWGILLIHPSSELEASLTLKVQEVDEADDRVREAFKSKVKLEKKVGKLQRQLAAATAADSETASNTAANKNLSLAALEMPPPPVPVSITAPIASATIAATRATPSGVQSTPFFTPRSAPLPSPSTRQPLRPVNVFDPKPSPSSAGLKRQREGDEKQLPAEMILLPPVNVDTATKRPVKLGFTPSRSLNALNVRGTAGDQNVPVSERRSMSRNIFSDQ
jgi:predicted  nucleic acid-binding Zn-ribbon protein